MKEPETGLPESFKEVMRLVREDPNGVIARYVFRGVLQAMPAVPNVPGKEVFLELMSKMVPLAVELVLFKDDDAEEVLLTYRADEFTGQHFPGTYRKPRKPLIEDAQRCADKEIGGIRITRVRQIGFAEHPDSPRFHDCGMVVVCDYEGEIREREGVGWFSTRVQPDDLIEVHHPYWEMITHERDARLVDL